MKQILLVMLAVILAMISITGCANTKEMLESKNNYYNSVNTNIDNSAIEQENEEDQDCFKIYIKQSVVDSISKYIDYINTDYKEYLENNKFRIIEEFPPYLNRTVNSSFVNSSAPQTREIVFNGEKYNCSYRFSKKNINGEEIQSYTEKGDNYNYNLSINSLSGKVVGVALNRDRGFANDPYNKINENEVLEIAEGLYNDYCAEYNIGDFKFIRTSTEKIPYADGGDQFNVVYSYMYKEKYMLSGNLIVFIDDDGFIRNFSFAVDNSYSNLLNTDNENLSKSISDLDSQKYKERIEQFVEYVLNNNNNGYDSYTIDYGPVVLRPDGKLYQECILVFNKSVFTPTVIKDDGKIIYGDDPNFFVEIVIMQE